MTMPSPDDATLHAFVMAMPKAELHVHIEGTMEPELYLDIAARNGIATPYADAEAVRQRLRDAHDLPSFIGIYEELIAAIRSAQDFRDLAMAFFAKAQSQGVVYAEVFFDPQLHLERGIPLAAIFGGLARARIEAEQTLGFKARYIMCFLRDRSADDALKVLRDSAPWRDEFIGIGLDNPEVDGFPDKFAAVFDEARGMGLRLTTHCDVGQPNTVAHHWGALDVLKVERIDHGLNVLDDPKLIDAVRERRIGLTAAPTLFYTEIPGRMEYRAGAIKQLLEHGLLVSLNSDDPGMKRSLYIGDLMLRAARTVGLSRDMLVQLARNSFVTAWLSDEERDAYLAQLETCDTAGA
ncbi:adenosine deaminase [Solimonas marina]|uniref:Adenosine deaminase n=1 Tax=Solimonas marina TaxID=2714601 RepID=A0A969WCL5_9GAMM|nr:adenosine deaminase [Solimonas marina]NKF24752.1 adenosine deaminase [Solimonas marina]